MCLAIPGQVKEIKDEIGVIDLGGTKMEVSITFIKDEVKINDWVLIHTGFALEILSEEEARLTIEAMNEAYHIEELPQS